MSPCVDIPNLEFLCKMKIPRQAAAVINLEAGAITTVMIAIKAAAVCGGSFNATSDRPLRNFDWTRCGLQLCTSHVVNPPPLPLSTIASESLQKH